jgi:calcium-dependent protein kinase
MVTKPDKRLTTEKILNHPWLEKMAGKSLSVQLPPLITQNLKNFSVTQKVKKVVLAYLATQVSEKETASLRKFFLGLDKNGDGILSIEEVKEGIKDRKDELELLALIENIDTDCSGFIDYNGKFCFNFVEFLAATLTEEIYTNQGKLLQAFKMFDKDKSGKIDANELKEILSTSLSKEDDSIWLRIIKDADLDGDGQIDFEEFMKLMYQNTSAKLTPTK